MSESAYPQPLEIKSYIGSLSDRAIQRIVGGNAFLRGRIYARRNSVTDVAAQSSTLNAKVLVRNDEPYTLELSLGSDGVIRSQCTCTAWRGPTGHCKHVAAVLVSLRDKERPARARVEESGVTAQTNGKSRVVAQTTSLGTTTKRRRSRRRRRGVGATNGEQVQTSPIGVVSARELGVSTDTRSSQEAWMPEETPRALEMEFRLVVRSASIVVTPVMAGTRSGIPITDALSGFNTVSNSLRPLLRLLARHAVRSQPATSELRGEDAAEVLSMLRDRRVLLEPASMELRFGDEPLRPRIELDAVGTKSVRLRVAFELKGMSRRFALSSGAWFEGTPGWYLDPSEGFARPLADTVTPGWLQRLYRSPSLVYPVEDLPRLLTEFIPRVASSLGADLPDLSTVSEVVDAHPRIQLRAEGDLVGAHISLRVFYDDLQLDVSTQGFPSPLAFHSPSGARGKPRVVRRDIGVEMAAVQSLYDLGFEVGEHGTLVAEGDKAIAFWTDGIRTLPREWDYRIPEDLAQVHIRQKPVMPRMRVSSGVDWLSLAMTFDAGGVAVSEDELRSCLMQGRRLVKLEDGSYAPVETENVREILDRMAELYVGGGSQSKLPLSQAGRVQDLMRLVADNAAAANTQQLFGRLQDVGTIDQVAKPRMLKATLRPYQKQGFSWLVFLHNLGTGGILADDMGLGKTLQAISLFLWVKTKQKEALSLVVAPTSVVPNWVREIEKFAPSLKVVMWQGPDRQKLAQEAAEADVIITSYALLRRDEEFLQNLNLTYAVLDEAQHIKNPLSATSRAAKKLKTVRRLALTGTPIENRLSEIWSIFDFVSPGLLGSLNEFEERYARPVDRGEAKVIGKLRATIHPFVMRRTKSEVAQDLPEKIEQEMIVPLAENQAKLYEQVLRQIRDSLLSEIEAQGVASSQIQILAALTRLRQVACDPRLLKLETDLEEESGKLNALRELVQEAIAGGHRMLVFSQFVEMLKIIRESLERDGIAYEYLDGSTKDRQAIVDRFNEEAGAPIFLISLKAGGVGLNLTGADTVVHFDPWWNPAVEDQATDRAHRIGQKKVVTVYRLIARGTVEEKILKLSSKKRELVANVLSTEEGSIRGLSRDDVEDLFSVANL